MKPLQWRISSRHGGAPARPMLMMMIMLSTTTMLQWIPSVESTPSHPAGRQVNSAPPVPGLPDNTDTTQRTSRATAPTAAPGPPGPPQLTASYLPAVMQAVAYYVDLLQYEIVDMTTVEPPYTLPQEDPTASTPSVAPTSKIPVSTTPRPPMSAAATTTASSVSVRPTVAHAPGYYAPLSVPMPVPVVPAAGAGASSVADGAASVATNADRNRPQMGTLPLLSISNQQFFNWFLQSKDEKVSQQSEYDLQYLHQLPSALLQDIRDERYEQPALLDADNVNEFRKVYDDFYGSRQPMTGKKRIPPTKPYVQMLMLYDLLKRDARRLMLNKFEGYTAATLRELNETADGSAERQLYTLFWRMIDRGDVDKDDIKARCQAIMIDLINPASVTAKALRYIPPLQFRL